MLRYVVILLCSLITVYCENCVTPYGANGNCINIQDCPTLLKSFINPTPEINMYLNLFKCKTSNNTKKYKVCCDNTLNSFELKKPTSNARYCGYQHTDDYNRDSNSTSIDEFPWLAAVFGVSKKTGKGSVICHGSLINTRYVVSVAQCFSTEATNIFDISHIRLGEFYLLNQTDCIELPNIKTEECNEAINVQIEKVVLHPHYQWDVELFDIALIRLKQYVTFSDYIRPICLPSFNNKDFKSGTNLYTTGWGTINYKGNTATVKKRILTKLISNEECEKIFLNVQITLKITYLLMCTIDEMTNKEFSCSGDAGAPVMLPINNQWQLVGMVSRGPPCGRNLPSFQTKVTNFVEWIHDNMEKF